MAVYKTKTFARFARDEGIGDRSLMEAVVRADKGLIDADLGGNIIKQRVARQGQGRSGAYRVSDRIPNAGAFRVSLRLRQT